MKLTRDTEVLSVNDLDKVSEKQYSFEAFEVKPADSNLELGPVPEKLVTEPPASVAQEADEAAAAEEAVSKEHMSAGVSERSGDL